MTELEILANLKIAYLRLEDIIENQYQQITEQEECELRVAMGILAEQYESTYKFAEKENINLEYKENIRVSKQIYHDYVLKTKENYDHYITYTDIKNEKKWWEDYDFLLN